MRRMLLWVMVLVVVGANFGACSDDVDKGGGDGIRTENSAPGEGDVGDDALDEGEVESCDPQEVLGCAGDGALLVCNNDGDGALSQTCPQEAPNCFMGECSEQLCIPGTFSCEDAQTLRTCSADGKRYEDHQTCPEGSICDGGRCETPCRLGVKERSSYFGCEYWTVFLDQYDETGIPGGTNSRDVPHAIVISNPNDETATILFSVFEHGVTIDIEDPTVPPGESRAFKMPRMDLGETGISRKGIFVQSTHPVTAHQFNPLNNERVYSNDASLLLPVSSLGTDYYVMNWPTQPMVSFPGMGDMKDQMSYVTIIATHPGETNLLVNSKANIVGGEGIASFPPGVPRSFTLDFGDVLNLKAGGGGLSGGANDLTGTFIRADQPIVVFAGHDQAVIRYDYDRDNCCADHLEQQLFPLDSWGQTYIGAFSPGRTQTKDHWRILAGEDNVTVTTVPPQPGANNVTLNAGEFVTFFSDENFVVEGTGKILVGQFLVSQEQTFEVTGDPAFLLAVPVERFREDYVVLVPEGYAKDYITVIRPAGVPVTLDGEFLDHSVFRAVGNGEWETGSFLVQAGVHRLEAAEPFGVNVYGMDNAVSYGYPGGLNVVGADAE